eukprot:6213033-Pleurochrysis_carterae.AAC.2
MSHDAERPVFRPTVLPAEMSFEHPPVPRAPLPSPPRANRLLLLPTCACQHVPVTPYDPPPPYENACAQGWFLPLSPHLCNTLAPPSNLTHNRSIDAWS